MLLRAARSCLLVVDVQARLAPHVHEAGRVIERCAWLVDLARALDVPVLATEHYPEGLGPLVPEVAERLPARAVVRKDHFSSLAEPAVRARLDAVGRDQLVVAGMEAHVCVLQSALDAAAAGRATFVVADAVSSRRPRDAELAIARMRGAGVTPVASEMVLFEWAERAGTERFRALHRRFLCASAAAPAPARDAVQPWT